MSTWPGECPGAGVSERCSSIVSRAVDHLAEPGLDDRQHAVAQRAADGGALFRIAIDAEEMVVVGLAEDVLRIRECRHPAAVVQFRIPADVIDVQMRAHHHVDVFGLCAGRREPFDVGRVEIVPERPMLARFVIADAGVDQDFPAADLDQPRVDAELEEAARRIVVIRHHPAHVPGDELVAPVGEECLRFEEVPVGFLDARDLGRADGCRGHATAGCVSRGRENLAAAARSARRAACGPPRDPRRADSARASPRRSRPSRRRAAPAR